MCTPHQHLIAIDPATGKEKWRFDPKLKTDKSFQHLTCRGVMYYDANNTTEFATSLQTKNRLLLNVHVKSLFQSMMVV
jgi:quinoprotein glucose dehydrogenase